MGNSLEQDSSRGLLDDRYIDTSETDDEMADVHESRSVGKSTFHIWRVRGIWLLVICVLEAFQLSIFYHALVGGRNTCVEEGSKSVDYITDSYSDLSVFSTTHLFRDNETWKESTPSEQDVLWRSLLPRAVGVVSLLVSTSTRLSLPPSSPNPFNANERVYRLGVFHQLHCLNTIRTALLSFMDPTTEASGGYAPEVAPPHIAHCIEYLRQATQCSSDVTLLSTRELVDFGVHGGDLHKCRDCGKIKDWADKWRFKRYAEVLRVKEPQLFDDGKV